MAEEVHVQRLARPRAEFCDLLARLLGIEHRARQRCRARPPPRPRPPARNPSRPPLAPARSDVPILKRSRSRRSGHMGPCPFADAEPYRISAMPSHSQFMKAGFRRFRAAQASAEMSRDPVRVPPVVSSRDHLPERDRHNACAQDRAARVGRPTRGGWHTLGAGMARRQAGEDRGAVRAGRQFRPAGAAPGARARDHLRPAVLHREPRRLLGRDRRRPGREVAARRLHAGQCRLRPAPDRPGDQSQYRLRPAQRLHPHRHAGSRQLRAGRQSGAGRQVDRRPRHDRPRPHPDLGVAGRGLARASDPRALQAQRQAQHPARALAQFRHAGRARQSHQPDLHDAAHRRAADPRRAAGAARGHLDRSAIRPIRTSQPSPSRDLPTCAATPGSGSPGPSGLVAVRGAASSIRRCAGS